MALLVISSLIIICFAAMYRYDDSFDAGGVKEDARTDKAISDGYIALCELDILS